MTLVEFGQSIGVEVPELNRAEISVVFANGAVMPRQDGIWKYEHDGRSSMSSDPKLAVIAAEGVNKGKIIFNSDNSEANEA